MSGNFNYFLFLKQLNWRYTMDRWLRLKPKLTQNTDYMVEKTDHLAQYWCSFGAYLMPQWPIQSSKGVSIYQNIRWNVALNSCYLPSGQKSISFGQKWIKQTIWLKLTLKYHMIPNKLSKHYFISSIFHN